MVATILSPGTKPLMSSLKVEVATDASVVSLHLNDPSQDDTYDSSLEHVGTSKGCPMGGLFNFQPANFQIFAKFSDGNSVALCDHPKMKVMIFKDQKEINVEKDNGEWCKFKLTPQDIGNLTIKVSYEDKSKEWTCHITDKKEL